MTKKEYELIIAQAEKLLAEWNLIKNVYPFLVREKVIRQNNFHDPQSLFLEVVHRRSRNEIEIRSRPHYEIMRPDKVRIWKEINDLTLALIKARQKGEGIDRETKQKLASLRTSREVFRDKLYESVILCAANIASENEEIRVLLREVGASHEVLASNAQEDWNTRFALRNKHSSETWFLGNRYVHSGGGQKKEAHYDHGFVRFVWSDDLLEALNGDMTLAPQELRDYIPHYLQLDPSQRAQAVEAWAEEALHSVTDPH